MQGAHVRVARAARRYPLTAAVMAVSLLAPGGALRCATLDVGVQDARGRGIAGMAVIAERSGGAGADAAHAPRAAVMDQRRLQFTPELLIVQTGTAVDFPNSDQTRHQVYSFSPAKPFQLALYAGRAHPPVVFDRPGIVTLGCNIHDQMIGYIYVTDSPWFGLTGRDGHLELHDLPAGDYTVRVWHPRLDEVPRELSTRLSIAADAAATAGFIVHRPLRPAPAQQAPGAKKWEDY
jgi:plastocyanin